MVNYSYCHSTATATTLVVLRSSGISGTLADGTVVNGAVTVPFLAALE